VGGGGRKKKRQRRTVAARTTQQQTRLPPRGPTQSKDATTLCGKQSSAVRLAQVWCFAEKWSMHVCANKHAHPTTASIDPCCGETHDISG